ncbi:MAG TPA: oxidoreductase [Steroidobacteraceae bacterium]|jgi:uncharacterized protein YbjT (DUF2867 family)|nr:oxidoreductase [Steroidobacteraceae bacterium]
MNAQQGRIALVAGGSGLIGGKLLPLLLAGSEYTRVQALSRRPLPLEHPRLANRVLRFDAPFGAQLKGLVCHDAFCCLGTTLRAAGSEAAFRAVDHDLVVAFAREALAAGAQRLVLVSAMGADPASKYLYLRVKGETERSLEALRPRSLDILQPALLLGVRREWRALELAAQPLMWAIGPLLRGSWARFRAIEAAAVAAAMRGAARSARRGVYRYTYRELLRLAGAAARPQL